MRKTFVKILSVALLAVLLVCAFSGCSDRSKLKGKWYDKNGDLVLNIKSDGTCELTEYSGTYIVVDYLDDEDPYIRIYLDIDDVPNNIDAVADLYYKFLDRNKIEVSVYLDDSYSGNMTLKKR